MSPNCATEDLGEKAEGVDENSMLVPVKLDAASLITNAEDLHKNATGQTSIPETKNDASVAHDERNAKAASAAAIVQEIGSILLQEALESRQVVLDAHQAVREAHQLILKSYQERDAEGRFVAPAWDPVPTTALHTSFESNLVEAVLEARQVALEAHQMVIEAHEIIQKAYQGGDTEQRSPDPDPESASEKELVARGAPRQAASELSVEVGRQEYPEFFIHPLSDQMGTEMHGNSVSELGLTSSSDTSAFAAVRPADHKWFRDWVAAEDLLVAKPKLDSNPDADLGSRQAKGVTDQDLLLEASSRSKTGSETEQASFSSKKMSEPKHDPAAQRNYAPACRLGCRICKAYRNHKYVPLQARKEKQSKATDLRAEIQDALNGLDEEGMGQNEGDAEALAESSLEVGNAEEHQQYESSSIFETKLGSKVHQADPLDSFPEEGDADDVHQQPESKSAVQSESSPSLEQITPAESPHVCYLWCKECNDARNRAPPPEPGHVCYLWCQQCSAARNDAVRRRP